MPQDRSGSTYEDYLAKLLAALGYQHDSDSGRNYIRPPKRGAPMIRGTYIQPDIIVRNGNTIVAIIYSTHWSNTRSSKYKFWRTWEEAAQQKLVLGPELLTINCIFEALPPNFTPSLFSTSSELPADEVRTGSRVLPVQLNGWDPGIGWAMIEAFDVSLIFPEEYSLYESQVGAEFSSHHGLALQLLANALQRQSKPYFCNKWYILSDLRESALKRLPTLTDTKSRYRVGLLHLYVLYRIAARVLGRRVPSFEVLVDAMVGQPYSDNHQVGEKIDLSRLADIVAHAGISENDLYDVFVAAQKVYVKSSQGDSPETLCRIETFSHPNGGQSIQRLVLNDDLRLCLSDLKNHMLVAGFSDTIRRAFARYDQAYGVDEALDDLSNPKLVEEKEAYVRQHFANFLNDEANLADQLVRYAAQNSDDRMLVSNHTQNWVLEMLLYMAGLNSTEDIQKRFKAQFESSGHQLRPHAPYGGHAQTVAFMLQGRDICEQWSNPSSKRTLTKDEFRLFSWAAVARCIVEAFKEKGTEQRAKDNMIRKYRINKSMRIISSDLNGFHILIEQFLGDMCALNFVDEDESGARILGARIRQSWLTEMINVLWGARPLETWFEGVSRNGRWVIKAQSSQDGNESHKTKELSGRSRAIQVSWLYEGSPNKRELWRFQRRILPKLALILDGDWSASKKQNLYEAGWDWVGDVSELDALRALIKAEE